MKCNILLLSLCLVINAEARPWKYQQRKQAMPLKTSLVAYWNMEQDPALFPIHDQTGNGNHLTGANGPILTTGKVGQAIEFNGINQYLAIDSNSGFSHQGDEFTAFVWFKPLTLAHQAVIAASTEWGIGTVLVGGSFFINVAIEDEEVTITDVPLEEGNWYFIVLGYNASDSYVWASVNLSPRVQEFQSSLTPSASGFSMAGSAAIGWANCIIDDSAMFRRLLSDSEIRAIYNKGKGLPFEDWDAPDNCPRIECCN